MTQPAFGKLEDSFEFALKVDLRKSMKQKRQERFKKILWWLTEDRSYRELDKARSIFWRKVIASRSMCSKHGSWDLVYLTKKQVDIISPILDRKLKEKSKQTSLCFDG